MQEKILSKLDREREREKSKEYGDRNSITISYINAIKVEEAIL